MTRLEANKKIVDILKQIVESNPDLRFGQILFNYVLNYSQSDSGQIHIDDPFYELSENTLKRIKERIKKYDLTRSSD